MKRLLLTMRARIEPLERELAEAKAKR